MTFQSSSFSSLLIALCVISLFPIAGALFSYFMLPRLRGKEKMFALLSAYLMITLSISLVAEHVLEVKLTQVSAWGLFSGFALGFCISLVLMQIHHRVSHAHNHWALAGVLLVMMTIHELTEAMGVAELFFEAPSNVPLQFAWVPLLVLAIHEFPEGVMLVLPFFMSRRIKMGILAIFMNQVVFIVSGILFYLFFFIRIEPAVHEEVFYSLLPAGGIFYLGIEELMKHLPRHEKKSHK